MEKNNLFEQGSIQKTYWTLALPVTLSMVLSVVYNVADTYFIARTQDTSLVAAVSLCAPVFTLLMAFGNIFGQGGTSLISRLFGKKDMDGTRRVSSFCFWAARCCCFRGRCCACWARTKTRFATPATTT